jgi:hypothetical protein
MTIELTPISQSIKTFDYHNNPYGQGILIESGLCRYDPWIEVREKQKSEFLPCSVLGRCGLWTGSLWPSPRPRTTTRRISIHYTTYIIYIPPKGNGAKR